MLEEKVVIAPLLPSADAHRRKQLAQVAGGAVPVNGISSKP